jgi:hypothetical protein
VGTIDEEVFLFRKEPDHGTGEERDAAVAEEIAGPAREDEVDLKFLVMMRGDRSQLVPNPDGKALGSGSDFELLLHGDKK